MILHRSFKRSSVKCFYGADEEPMMHKIHTIDKSVYDKKREIYDNFVYSPNEYLTTNEMKQITQHHMVSLRCKKNKLYLQLSPDTIENEDYWEPITDILNDLLLMNFIREELHIIPEPLEAPLLVPLPIEYVGASNQETRYTEWIDFSDFTMNLEEPDII